MDLNKMRKIAIKYGRAQGLSGELAEDMAQNWLINIAVKKTNQTLHQAYVDLMRSEYGRSSNFRKHDYFLLKEDMGASYVLPEIYLTDCSPERLKKRLSKKQFRLLQLMAKEIGFDERCKKMRTTGYTVFHWQQQIRHEINAIFETNYSVHRCTRSRLL